MKRVLPIILVLLVSLPASAQPKRRVLDKKFWLALGTAYALTVVDIELTQRCIRAGNCREANPLLGQSRGRAYAVNAAILVPVTIWSYHRKKDQDRNGRQKGKMPWWLPSVVSSGSHTVGMSMGLYASTVGRRPRASGTLPSVPPNFSLGPRPDPMTAPQSWRVGFDAMGSLGHVQALFSTTQQQGVERLGLRLTQDRLSQFPLPPSGGSSPRR